MQSGVLREGGRGNPVADPLLAHPEICQFAVALVVQQYVVQFQISARNTEQQIWWGSWPQTTYLAELGYEMAGQTARESFLHSTLERGHTSLCYVDNRLRSTLEICSEVLDDGSI